MLIIQRTEQIANELQKYMNNICFRFKNSDDTTEYNEVKPTVYSFTFDDDTESTPLKTPSVLIQFTGLNADNIASFLVYINICNPALQDKEIVVPVEGKTNVYKYLDTDNINTSSVRLNLYKSCLMLAEQVYIALGKMSNSSQNITNIELQPPSPYLEKFPYCECTITFDSEIPNAKSFCINNTYVQKYL